MECQVVSNKTNALARPIWSQPPNRELFKPCASSRLCICFFIVHLTHNTDLDILLFGFQGLGLLGCFSSSQFSRLEFVFARSHSVRHQKAIPHGSRNVPTNALCGAGKYCDCGMYIFDIGLGLGLVSPAHLGEYPFSYQDL